MASLDAKDSYTKGHSERVSYIAQEIAHEMGLSEDEIELTRLAGLVHDLGKIGVPENVLRKPGRLTEEEFSLVKMHPEIGRKIVQEIPMIFRLVPAVLHHHERWDGRGYPAGLESESIPLYARILAVADSFDAMSSTRTYKASLSREEVLAEMERCNGTQFDPEVVEALLRADLSKYEQMLDSHRAEKDAA